MTASPRLFICATLVVLFSTLFPTFSFAQRVAIVAADIGAPVADVRAKLIGAGLTDVTVINIANVAPVPPVPTLAELQQYNVIFTWSNYDYVSSATLGDRLADYVDQGGSVVQAAFSLQTSPTGRLDGRWRAEAYEPFTLGTFAAPTFGLTLVASNPSHPILAGVTSFNGGGASYSHAGVQPQGCAEVVARWSNGRLLVAARVAPRGGRVIGLNFYPASSDALSANYWNSTTKGGLLMANAIRFAATPVVLPSADAPRVAVVAADLPARVSDVACKLQRTNEFSRVDVFDAQVGTPTPGSLAGYDSVLTWSNGAYANSASLGNILADYVDDNRGVVQSVFSFSTASALGGRWQTDMSPLSPADVVGVPNQTLVADAPGHVLLAGVTSFNGGTSSFHSSPTLPRPGSALVATWSTGQPLVVAQQQASGGRVVGLNMYPPSSDAATGLWDSRTDGTRLIANALLYAANRFPSADAGPDQTLEAGAGGASFTLNATAGDADGDVLSFTWSGAVSGNGQSIVVDVPPPTSPNQTQTFALVLTVNDGKGGVGTDTVNLTVTDLTAPTLTNVPTGIVTVPAASSSGAEMTFESVTATDAVDGTVPATCAPSGQFPVGDTQVTCSAADSRGNSTSASFTVRVTPPPPPPPPPPDEELPSEAPPTDPAPPTEPLSQPGRAFGIGSIRRQAGVYDFSFRAGEGLSGLENGALILGVKSHQPGRRGGAWSEDHFVARTVERVTFNLSEMTVLLAGRGRWNGQNGYLYEVLAADKKHARHNPGHDWIRVVVKSPAGAVVATVEGTLTSGSVHIIRVRR